MDPFVLPNRTLWLFWNEGSLIEQKVIKVTPQKVTPKTHRQMISEGRLLEAKIEVATFSLHKNKGRVLEMDTGWFSQAVPSIQLVAE